MSTNMQNKYPGKGYICSYCDSLFDGDECPNCGSTSFKKTQNMLNWERQQQEMQSQQKLVDMLSNLTGKDISIQNGNVQYSTNNNNNTNNNNDNSNKTNFVAIMASVVVIAAFIIAVTSMVKL